MLLFELLLQSFSETFLAKQSSPSHQFVIELNATSTTVSSGPCLFEMGKYFYNISKGLKTLLFSYEKEIQCTKAVLEESKTWSRNKREFVQQVSWW